MKNTSDKRKKKMRMRRIINIAGGILVMVGVFAVIVICLGEISSLYKRYRADYVVSAEDTVNPEFTERDTRKSSSQDDKETESETQSEMQETQPETESEMQTELTEMSDDEKIEEVFANRSLYPEKVLEMLDKNMETLDFVYNYPEKAGTWDAGPLSTDDIDGGEIPLLIQWDERWGYAGYGENIIGTGGCGPTCMAMVIVGLTGNLSVTPYTMAVYSEENGYITQDGNTLWSFITDGGTEFGVRGQAVSLNEKTVISALSEGYPLICSVREGDFTDGGHFIVLTDYIDGKIRVNDPYSYENSEKLWEYEVLEPQIKNIWKMEAISAD